ncbi:MAG: PDZ domain-containing protein [Bacillaceae bacterium]|nr:PDZ domain-containing protein [Bacillaceae bacterium]
MVEIWLMEIGKGVLWLFGQPLLYGAIIITMITSILRIKQERKTFGIRIFPIGSEWKGTWGITLAAGIVLSAGLIASGGVLPYSFFVWLGILTILFSITGRLFLSPAYIFGAAVLLLWISETFDLLPEEVIWLDRFNQISLPLLLMLLAILLIAEAVLAKTVRRNDTFPRLVKGKRGKFIGQHLVRKISVVPAFVPVPGGNVDLVWEWWPLFPLGNEGIGLMLVPFLIGFEQVFQGSFADEGAKKHGTWLIVLAIVIAGLAYGSLSFTYLIPAAAVLAIAGKLLIHLWIRFVDLEKVPLFSPEPEALPVLGVIPGSPADEMDLMAGEKIKKVHQIPVANEQEFYQALQKNRTYIKLEVLNLEGEPRFVQRAMYEGEHHELGLIFVKEKPKFKLYSVQDDKPDETNLDHVSEK